MTKRSLLKNYGVFFLTAIFISGGCNSNTSADKSTAAEPAATEATTGTSTQSAVASFGGKLDTLIVDSLAFTKLGNSKAVFAFIFLDKDTLTLHGWKVKTGSTNEFDSLPDIRLTKLSPGNLSYGPGTYFGNVVLSKNDVNEIQKQLIKVAANFVLFAPYKLGEHIRYKIFISKGDTKAIHPLVLPIETGVFANPSPPRN